MAEIGLVRNRTGSPWLNHRNQKRSGVLVVTLSNPAVINFSGAGLVTNRNLHARRDPLDADARKIHSHGKVSPLQGLVNP